MTLEDIFRDKSLKSKAKTEMICSMITKNELQIHALISFAEKSKDHIKATCIEAIEFATSTNPAIADKKCWQFIVHSLSSKTPRVKWESARVVSNICKLYENDLNAAITNLLTNAEAEGTVVRWSAALALGEILKLNTQHNRDLIPVINNIITLEEKNSIKKIYLAALKKCQA